MVHFFLNFHLIRYETSTFNSAVAHDDGEFSNSTATRGQTCALRPGQKTMHVDH